jgi:error-prone DNA polymerase
MPTSNFAQLHCLTNYSFLRSASHPHELVQEAARLGYGALAVTDECSLAGMVKAHTAAEEYGLKLIVGSEFVLSNGCRIVALVTDKNAYRELSGFITLARRRATKGCYEAHLNDLRFRLQNCLVIWRPEFSTDTEIQQQHRKQARELVRAFRKRLWLGVDHRYNAGEQEAFTFWQSLSDGSGIPLVACGTVLMHTAKRKPLHDVLTAIRHNQPVQQLGSRLQANAEAYLKPLERLQQLYVEPLLQETSVIAERCHFSMSELYYQYPEEVVPKTMTASEYLRQLVAAGAQKRWPQGVPQKVQGSINKELSIIEELAYEYYFLTVYDIVSFARKHNIMCQGRGSAANSIVCYCLFITEIGPEKINVLFERFISKERDEPPDIDVDFENARREEVIQYIYQKYGRERAALAATVITYRSKSALRDVGKAIGFEPDLVNSLTSSLTWWDRSGDLERRIGQQKSENNADPKTLDLFFRLVKQILGFPRHLSQHVGGFVITQDKISDIVPLENAAMAERTIIQWDKEDLEAMSLMKVDVLALGMLTALRKGLALVSSYGPKITALADIPQDDEATYRMLCRADSVGVFQVESRAQMSMLPRLKPRCFYDLVIQIAIVRPGPIQGDMVHPYLQRRNGEQSISYPNAAVKSVLERTLGIPIFQEQAIKLAMVAAGFTGGQADRLRRAMASWGKNGNLLKFEQQFMHGMHSNGYSADYAESLFEQIKGFGGYGFPESHSASFALLCYASSWLKCHHPAAFYASLLNSQPMGFYSPSQLVQDARRHRVVIHPPCVNTSHWESTLVFTDAHEPAIQLGFNRIKSFPQQSAEMIMEVRTSGPFTTLLDFHRRTALAKDDLQTLVAADALSALSGHRQQAYWDAAALEPARPLLDDAPASEALTTPPASEAQEVNADYQTTGLSLRAHPMALLRREQPFNQCKTQTDLQTMGNGRFVRVAGLVTGRQRPGTAKGTVFVTLEDETGNINVVVWKATQEQFRRELLTSRLLLIKGRLEIKDQVIHIIAGQLYDYSDRLMGLTLKSRDFH